MVELDQFKATLNSYAKPLEEMRDSLDLENKEKRIEELERKMEEPDFWDNPERSQEMMKELKSLKDDKEIYENLESQRDDMETLIEMDTKKMMLRSSLRFKRSWISSRLISRRFV